MYMYSRMLKPMICPWNNNPSAATGKTAAFASKPAINSRHNVAEEFYEVSNLFSIEVK